MSTAAWCREMDHRDKPQRPDSALPWPTCSPFHWPFPISTSSEHLQESLTLRFRNNGMQLSICDEAAKPNKEFGRRERWKSDHCYGCLHNHPATLQLHAICVSTNGGFMLISRAESTFLLGISSNNFCLIQGIRSISLRTTWFVAPPTFCEGCWLMYGAENKKAQA
ncbi:hypothetical protein BT69DRAFT_1299527 [Atractiella rhizophila]|nr:hypothetical protein BT69DRAFT_1299527 [Atractiella rhizophila]